MRGIQEKSDSPRWNITLRRCNCARVLHRCDLHCDGRLLGGHALKRHIRPDLLRLRDESLGFKLLGHVRSEVALVLPASPTTHRVCGQNGYRGLPRSESGIQRYSRHPLTFAARGRVGQTRAANDHLPSVSGHTRTQSHEITNARRALAILLGEATNAHADQHCDYRFDGTHRFPFVTSSSPEKAHGGVCNIAHADSGTTLRFGYIKYLGSDCDVTKDALRQFNEASLIFSLAMCGAGARRTCPQYCPFLPSPQARAGLEEAVARAGRAPHNGTDKH
jgi:hypothetical protein